MMKFLARFVALRIKRFLTGLVNETSPINVTSSKRLNIEKYAFVKITRKHTPLTFNYSISDCLKQMQTFNYVGVMISGNLKWDGHIEIIYQESMTKLDFEEST